MERGASEARAALGRPLGLAEKALFGRLWGGAAAWRGLTAAGGGGRVRLRPDRVLLPDGAAPLALLQLAAAGVARVAVPGTVHCDSLCPPSAGIPEDASLESGDLGAGGSGETALGEQTGAEGGLGERGGGDHDGELVSFLEKSGAGLGLGLWRPGGGAAHQVLLENHAVPGELIVGPDSQAVAAGGLGSLAICVSGPDAVDVLAGKPLELPSTPPVIGVRLLGKFHGWTAAQDVFLRLAAILHPEGSAAGAILEYFGPGVAHLSCAGRAAICHMGGEIGAIASIFPHDPRTGEYLAATGRSEVAEAASAFPDLLRPDEGCEYSRVVEVDLSDLEPHVGGPGQLSLGQIHPLSRLPEALQELGCPTDLQAGLLGSGASSSYEDLARSASVARQALKAELRSQIPFVVVPSSESIRSASERDGKLKKFEELGGEIRASGNGPWGRCGAAEQQGSEAVSIITSSGSTSPGDLDSDPNTRAFVASPELVAAFTLAGDLSFNPEQDSLVGADSSEITLNPPSGDEFPERGFDAAASAAFYRAPLGEGSDLPPSGTSFAPESGCLQPLPAFEAWDGKDQMSLRVLAKFGANCATHQIMPTDREGARFRAHVEKASEELFAGAAAGDLPRGKLEHPETRELVRTAEMARDWQAAGVRWVAVAGESYGEGGVCEMAALATRSLGGAAVLAKSFGRVHEANLKRHGMLPLTFARASDYGVVEPGDELSVSGLRKLGSARSLALSGTKVDGSTYEFELQHSFASHEVEWFYAGGFLNLLKGPE